MYNLLNNPPPLKKPGCATEYDSEFVTLFLDD